MNIIQRQADDFTLYKLKLSGKYGDFINEVRSELFEYRKTTHKIEFIERIIQNVKIKYDKHLLVCTNKKNCPENEYYENILFFLQEELEELEEELSPIEFTKIEKNSVNETLQKIISDINLLKLGQEITYDDFKEDFEELKDMYYLNKKTWLQLFIGKLSNRVASGIISESLSKELLEIISLNYNDLISN